LYGEGKSGSAKKNKKNKGKGGKYSAKRKKAGWGRPHDGRSEIIRTSGIKKRGWGGGLVRKWGPPKKASHYRTNLERKTWSRRGG